MTGAIGAGAVEVFLTGGFEAIPASSFPISFACKMGGMFALVVAGVALVLQSLGQVGPATAALTLCARGHWLLTEPIFWPCITSLGAGVAAMIAAMALRAEHRR